MSDKPVPPPTIFARKPFSQIAIAAILANPSCLFWKLETGNYVLPTTLLAAKRFFANDIAAATAAIFPSDPSEDGEWLTELAAVVSHEWGEVNFTENR